MYLRPVTPDNECKTCRYLTKIFKSDDGRRFCDFLEKFVSEDSLCPEYRRGCGMTDNPFLCYNCIYLTDWTGNVIQCSRQDRLYNPRTRCNYFKEQWNGGKGDVE